MKGDRTMDKEGLYYNLEQLLVDKRLRESRLKELKFEEECLDKTNKEIKEVIKELAKYGK